MVTKMKKLNAGGFSLVELMVVVAIIGILASVAIPNFQRFQRKARASEGKTLMGGLFTSEQAFFAEWDGYTGDFEDVGYGPTGSLRYNVGFAGIGFVPPAPFMTGATAFTNTGACPGAAPLNNCTMAAAMPAGTSPMAANPTATTFRIGALSMIGGTVDDDWTMDQAKTVVMNFDGTL